MNLFFYLKTFILNYSFIVILSDLFFFVLCFIKTQPFVNRKPVKAEKKNTGTIAFRFRQVLLYLHVFVVFYVSLGPSPYRRAFFEECTGVSLCTFWYLAVSAYSLWHCVSCHEGKCN